MRWRSIGPGPRRPIDCGGRQRRARRTSTTSAPSAAACGRPPTSATPGLRSATRTSAPRRSARSPSRRRIPTSSTPAWASRASAATSSRATASTRPPTPARPGRTSASPTPRSSARSASTRPIPTSSTPRCSATPTTRIPTRGVYRSKDGGKTWEQRALPQRPQRRHRPVDGSEESRRALRGDLGGLPHAVVDGERRSGQRALQVDRRRHDVDRHHEEPGPADGPVGQGRRLGLRRRQQSRLRHHRKRQRRRVRVRRCGRDVAARPTRIATCGSARSTTRTSTPIRSTRTRSTSSTSSSSSRPTAARRSRRRFASPHGDNHDMWIAPNDNKRMVQANDGGGNVSVNGGQTWSGQGFPTGQFYNVFTTRHVPYHVCGAQQDNSTACVGSQNNPGARRGQPAADLLRRGRRRERLHRAGSERHGNVFFAGSYGGYLSRLDRDTGQQRAVNIYPNNPMGWSSVDIKERFQWTFPIVFSPTDPKVLYASSQHLWRTTNGGQSWQNDQPEPHALRSEDDAGVGRADHQGSDRRRDLRGDLHGRAVAPGRQHDLDRIGRRLGARDARRRQELGARHAARSAGLHAHQPDRSVAAPERRRLSRRQPLPAGRSRAVPLQDGGLRQDVDEDRHRHSRHRFRARHSRRSRSGAGCSTPGPSTASTSRSTTARRGSRCG